MFWGFGAKIKPAFCDVWSVEVLSIELSNQVLVELDCSFLDGDVATNKARFYVVDQIYTVKRLV